MWGKPRILEYSSNSKIVRRLEANPSSVGTGPGLERPSHLKGTFLNIPPVEHKLGL